MAWQVLIAHAFGEEEQAELLAGPLRAAGYTVAHQGTVMVGESVIAEASKLLSGGNPVVLCGTVRALGTPWARRVVNAARRHVGVRVFIVQMEVDADTESVAYDETIARYWEDPVKAVDNLIESLQKYYPLGTPNASVPTEQIRPYLRRPLHNLPAPLSSFIGREREIVETKRLLAEGRLLTLTGIGGSGKTRLALRIAQELLSDYRDGVWLIHLESLPNSALIPRSLASVFNIVETPSQNLMETLKEFLRSKSILLIFDNCEHMIFEVASLAEELLHACPDLKIITTSRELLGILGEICFRVGSLKVPIIGKRLSLDELLDYEAVQLFGERARAANPDFDLSLNAETVVEICRRLDGIPLAIELAAVRVRTLSVQEIANRLSDRFRLLTGGVRTALPRHQTLKALFDWSHNLLSEIEQVIFRRLVVFAGGWTAEAAEIVCASGIVKSEQVLDLLGSLVDKSLVIAEVRGQEMRYRLLQSVREYGQEKLEASGETIVIRDRHLEWYLAFMERAEPKLISREQLTWFSQVDAELDNFRTALEWARLQESTTESELRLATALGRFWLAHGYAAEGRGWLSDALGRTETVPSDTRVTALNWAGNFELEFGNLDAARTFGEASVTMARELGDPQSLAFATRHLAMIIEAQGDYERAQTLYQSAIVAATEANDRREKGFALTQLGQLVLEQDDLDQARDLLTSGQQILREIADGIGLISNLRSCAELAASRGSLLEGEDLLNEALKYAEAIGYKVLTAWTLIDLGDLLRASGDIAAAELYLRDALAITIDNGTPGPLSDAVRSFAGLQVTKGSFETATRLFGAEYVWRAGSPIGHRRQRTQYEADVATARRELGDTAWTAYWTAGQTMSLIEAVGYVRAPEPRR